MMERVQLCIEMGVTDLVLIYTVARQRGLDVESFVKKAVANEIGRVREPGGGESE